MGVLLRLVEKENPSGQTGLGVLNAWTELISLPISKEYGVGGPMILATDWRSVAVPEWFDSQFEHVECLTGK